MKIVVVAPSVPDPHGTASGRGLWAFCEGAITLGHDVGVWTWNRPAYPPKSEPPAWCRFEPYEPATGPMWSEHFRSVVRPRWGLASCGWSPPEDAVVIADEVASYPAVAGFARSALVVHYRPAADALALRHLRLSLVQDARAERRAARGAGLVLAYSARVARHLAGRARVVPVACAIPAQPLEANDAPVAAMIADWLWPPNLRALGVLLACWPEVRRAVPGARLLLAGRSLDRVGVGSVPGVSLMGEVPSAADVLSQASVLAFPCPNSSGPKVKVLEALSYGLPVVTTPAGVEGLVLGPGEGADVGVISDFGARLAGLLGSPERRAEVGRSGRSAMERHHAPVRAARARLDAIADAFGTDLALAKM